MKARKKVGIALGGGVARGIAHVGVLKVLQRERIPIDMVAGTSAGAIIGCLFAQGKDAVQIERIVLEVTSQGWTHFIDPSLPKSGLIHGKRIKELLKRHIGGNVKFSDLKLPFSCVAADIETGEELVLDRGSVAEAVRASMSLPGILSLVRCKNRYLVDGGIVNPVPANVVQQMGADFIIGVNVIPGTAKQVEAHRGKGEGRSGEPGIFHVLVQSAQIGSYSLAKASLEYADVAIEPEVAHIGLGDFHEARELIRLGEAAAEEAVPEIQRKLAAR